MPGDATPVTWTPPPQPASAVTTEGVYGRDSASAENDGSLLMSSKLHREQIQAMHWQSNLSLIPIYTDWVNRYLAKAQLEPIRDLTNQLREPKLLVAALKAITSDCIGASNDSLQCSLNASSKVAIVDKCLRYLAELGVNVLGINSREVVQGELGTILALLYALSHFKQQQKSLQFPRTIVKLPSVSSFKGSTSALSESSNSAKQQKLSKMSPNTPTRLQSQLRTPRVIAVSPSVATTLSVTSSSSSISQLTTPVHSSGLKKPTAGIALPSKLAPPTTGIKAGLSATTRIAPSRGSTATNTSSNSSHPSPALCNGRGRLSEPSVAATLPVSSRLKPLSGTNSTQSTHTPPSTPAQTASAIKPPSYTSTVPHPPSTSTRVAPSRLAAPSGAAASSSKMLKLFGKDKTPKPDARQSQSSARTTSATLLKPKAFSKSPTPAKIPVPSGSKVSGSGGTGLRLPSATKLSPPSSLPSGIAARSAGKKAMRLQPPSPNQAHRNSKSSGTGDEDTGFSSQQSSLTTSGSSALSQPQPAASQGVLPRQTIASTSSEGDSDRGEQRVSPSNQTTPSTSTHSPSDFDDSGVHSDTTNPRTASGCSPGQDQKPTLAVKAMTKLPTALSTPSVEVKRSPGSTGPVGIVSPMVSRQPAPEIASAKGNNSTDEKAISDERHQKRTNNNEALPASDADDKEAIEEVVPMMPLRFTDIAGIRAKLPGGEGSGLVSDDSLTSISTTLRCPPPSTGAPQPISSCRTSTSGFVVGEGEALVIPDTPTKLSEAQAQAKKHSRMVSTEVIRGMKNPSRYDFNDSFEDSSSLSSGISENFDDVSTDDLTGSSVCDFPMTVVATASHHTGPGPSNGYSKRSASSAGGAGLPPGGGYHSLSLRSKTSCRPSGGLPNVGQYSSRIYASTGTPATIPKVDLSEDGDTLSVSRGGPGRSSLRYAQPSTGRSIASARQTTTLSGGRHHSPSSSAASVVNGGGHYQVLPHNGYQTTPPLANAYHTHSLDRQGHLKAFIDPSSPGSPYRLSLAPLSPRHPTMGSEGYSSGRQSVTGSYSARSENSDVYVNFHGLQLHKLANGSASAASTPTRMPLTKLQRPLPQGGSEASIASSIGSEERYEAEIRRLHFDIETYKKELCRRETNESRYYQMTQIFDSRLQALVRHIEKLNQKSQSKEDEIARLRAQLDFLHAQNPSAADGTSSGCSLARHPSMESVASHRSSFSTSSKTSKVNSENGGGGTPKNGKKSWIRSSFTRAFAKGKKSKNGATSDVEQSPLHHGLHPIAGSTGNLDEIVPIPGELVELKKQLQSKNEALKDVCLDNLDKAREVDVLRETVARLTNENKMLKRNCTLLAKKFDSRTSSRQSLSTCQDEDPVYDPLPTTGGSSSSHMSERSFASASTTSSSKRSSGGGLATRVCISLEPSGSLEFNHHQHELTIGSLVPPTASTSWQDIDSQLTVMLKEYLHRVERDSTMGIDITKTLIGYRVGTDFVRNRSGPDLLTPSQTPADTISPSTTIRIRLQGVCQHAVDGLVVESLFPRAVLEQLIRLVEQSRRLVIHGARGIGKSNLAKTLAKYFSFKLASTAGKPESIVDVRYPDDEKDPKFAGVQANLQSMLKTGSTAILLVDNVHRRNIPHLTAAFNACDAATGPIVICTINGALQRQVEELQKTHAFRVFHLTNHMDAVRGFMGRYLRRRIAEAELTGQCRCGEQLHAVIDFLNKALVAINSFIEKANAHDETIGPRTFVQCPLSVEASRDWFIRLWNENLVPYMIRAAKEGMILGCRGQLRDPTEFIINNWPWPDTTESRLLHRVILDVGGPNTAEFDPMLALERIEENRKLQEQVHVN